jgi:hypothetical protein
MASAKLDITNIVAPEWLPSISAEQAAAIYDQGKEAVVFSLLELAKQLAEARSPSINPATPSAMIPVYQKPPSQSRKKKPGAKIKHPGTCRAKPAESITIKSIVQRAAPTVVAN